MDAATARRTDVAGDKAAELFENFDIYDAAQPTVVYEVTGRARQTCPVLRSEANGGYWLVTRYEDVKAVLQDDDTYLSGPGKSLPIRQTHHMPPLDADPPMHREYRLLLNRFFSRTALAPYVDTMRAMAQRTMDRWWDGGRCELIGEFAAPYTAAVLTFVILNLDSDETIREVQHLVGQIATANAASAWHDLSHFVTDLLERRRHEDAERDDVLGAILNGDVAGRPLTDEEQIGITTVLLLGGLDTTKGAIGSIALHLAQDRTLEEHLRTGDWTVFDLDEFLRLDSPVPALARTVAHDTELGGVPLHAGEHVLIHYGSANRDAAIFDDADRLCLGRRKNPHLAFGAGIHRCIGSNLARLSITAAVGELLDRCTNLRLAEGAEVRYSPGGSWHPMTLDLLYDKR